MGVLMSLLVFGGFEKNDGRGFFVCDEAGKLNVGVCSGNLV